MDQLWLKSSQKKLTGWLNMCNTFSTDAVKAKKNAWAPPIIGSESAIFTGYSFDPAVAVRNDQVCW